MNQKDCSSIVKSTQDIDPIHKNFLKRASILLNNQSITSLQPIKLYYKTRKNVKKFPSRTKTIFPVLDISSLKNKQKINAGFTFLISFLIIGVSLYECRKVRNNNYGIAYESNLIRIIMIGLSFIQILLIIWYYLSKLRLKVSYRIISKHSNFLHDKKLFSRLLFEIFICLMMFPPYYTYNLTFYQISIKQVLSSEEALIGIILFRAVHFFKFVYEYYYFNSSRSIFYCSLLGIDDEFSFMLKSLLKGSRFFSILVLSFLSVSVFTALVFFYEEGVESSILSNIMNCLWLICVTETTIGYGDITSKTHLGRMVSVFSGLFGVFLYSFILTNFKAVIELTKNEARLTSLIQHKLNYKKKIRSSAIVLIQRWWRLTLRRRHNQVNLHNHFQFQVYLRRFSLVHNIISQAKNPSISVEVNKISENSHIQKLSLFLESFKPIEKKAVILKNLNLRSAIKIKNFSNKARRLLGARKSTGEKILLNSPRSFRGSIDTSRVLMKKVKLEAVKKLLNVKVKRMSHQSSQKSLLSDDDFFSSKRSSFSYLNEREKEGEVIRGK